MVMTTVGIADLKARLSHWIRRVRRGESVVVLDRTTPVASLQPLTPSGLVPVDSPPDPEAPKFRDLRFRKLRRDVDPDRALAAVREDRI